MLSLASEFGFVIEQVPGTPAPKLLVCVSWLSGSYRIRIVFLGDPNPKMFVDWIKMDRSIDSSVGAEEFGAGAFTPNCQKGDERVTQFIAAGSAEATTTDRIGSKGCFAIHEAQE